MISRGLTRQSISDAYLPTNTSLHMLAAFDFTVGGDLCDRTAEQAFRLPTLLALPPRVYGAPWITDGYESSFHSAAETIFSLQAVIPFCVRYSCRFVFLRRNLSVCPPVLMFPMLGHFVHPRVLRYCENGRLH